MDHGVPQEPQEPEPQGPSDAVDHVGEAKGAQQERISHSACGSGCF